MALPLPASDAQGCVGRSVPRREGVDKVTGRARYTDDLDVPHAWFGQTVRSPIARGTLRGVILDPAFDWREVVVVTAADIPGDNVVHLIKDDQPALVERSIRHIAEPVALVAAPTRDLLHEAAQHIRLEYDTLEPVLDPAESTQEIATIDIAKGDVDAALAAADLIVERSFTVGSQEQLYIEPQGAVAVPRDERGITVHGSMQCPYYVHAALVRALDLAADQVVVVQAETGGAFGGKEEFPSVIAIHAALLALKAERPVRVIYDRHEDIIATTKRHPGVIRHRTGVLKDGSLVAQDIDLLLDAGAYATLSRVVLSRAAIHAAGPYACPNVRIRARANATNTPPNGAFRGFGAPQSQFAAELMVDHVAERLGVSSVALRRKWVLRLGDDTATSQRLTESVSGELVLDTALRQAHEPPPIPSPSVRRGRGLALVYHGAGFTGSGEKHLAGRVAVECTHEDTYRVLTAQTEMGQGTYTILAQLAADALGVTYDTVTVVPPDTSVVPNSGPTVASRTAMIVGNLVVEAATELRDRLRRERPPLRVEKTYTHPEDIVWDDERYRGDAYPAFSWACVIADVLVDIDTGEVRVTDITAAVDLGKALHPVLAEGQIEGGVLQAAGWATVEELKSQGGRFQNDRLATYIIPTSLDAPRINAILVENPCTRGPWGAKGVGEIPMDCPAPAIVAAIHDAVGVWIDEIPATQEKILRALGT